MTKLRVSIRNFAENARVCFGLKLTRDGSDNICCAPVGGIQLLSDSVSCFYCPSFRIINSQVITKFM